jgi:hypothetical protein
MDQMIRSALQEVPTDILEAEQVVVVQVIHDGSGQLGATLPKKPAKKRA